MKLKSSLIEICAALLVLLWLYAALSKLSNYERSQNQMIAQVFPKVVALQLTWLVPLVEIGAALLLIAKNTLLKGLYASVCLLSAFTIYIAVTMSGTFGKIPCSCGGILKHMGYWQHLFFNLLFIAIAILAIILEKQHISINEERRPAKIT